MTPPPPKLGGDLKKLGEIDLKKGVEMVEMG